MNKWKYDTKEIEDFTEFVVGACWVALICFVVAGVGLMAIKALGLYFV